MGSYFSYHRPATQLADLSQHLESDQLQEVDPFQHAALDLYHDPDLDQESDSRQESNQDLDPIHTVFLIILSSKILRQFRPSH